jgi:putative transposase
LHSQAQALLAADFLETITLTGTRMYILAVIEHASRPRVQRQRASSEQG